MDLNSLKKIKTMETIEVGKVADLVLLNANPLIDISSTRHIYGVIKNGEVYDPKLIAEEINCENCIVQD